MEDDDEFGDLYTDVLRPFTASFQATNQETDAPPAGANAAPSSHSRPIDLSRNSVDEEILFGASDSKNSNSRISSRTDSNLNVPAKEPTLPEPDIRQERRKFDLNFDFTSEGLAESRGRGSEFEDRFLEKDDGVKLPQKVSNLIAGGDDDIDIVVEVRDTEDDDLLGKDNNFIIDKQQDIYNSAAQENNSGKESEEVSEQMIPGLSVKLDNPRGSNFEDEWDSEDSEDDLQIVLNDNDHGPLGMERMPGVDEDEEPLVIVDKGDESYHHHNQQMMMEEQQWGEEEGAAAADRDMKELGDPTKTSVAVGSTTQAALQPKIGYSNHAYHPLFHSQFKYVRPGAATVPGAAPVTSGGIPAQVRPPFPAGPLGGRGKGDWRPTGIKGDMPMQKGFRPGYGAPPWGANPAGRGYGSGLDFTLPSHKTIFEVDIDNFEEKPWKLPGIDLSDFFNFGLNEESWKDYRKQLEQLRLGTTMQNKIRVYESGRAEQDYDPDLPPELAAAVGIQDIPSESTNPRNIDAVPANSATIRGRHPHPVGRPIPVEMSSGDRLPSVDTRRQRMHDNDAIIEIFCHSSKDDDDTAEQQGGDLSDEVDIGGGDDIDNLQHDDVERDHISHAYNGRKREPIAKRGHSKHSSPEVSEHQQPDEEIGVPDDRRSAKGRGRLRSLKTSAPHEEKSPDNQDEESFYSGNSKQSPPLSSSRAIGSDGEQPEIARDDTNDNKPVMEDRSFDMEREDLSVDEATKDILNNKQLLSSEQLPEEKDDREGSKVARNGGISSVRSGSSKDNQKFHDDEDEVLQERRPPRAGNSKIPVGDEDYAHRKGRHARVETGRKHVPAKGREESFSRGSGEHNLSIRRHMNGESADWRKESDASWRDDDRHGRWNRVDETRKTDHGGEIGSRNRVKVRGSEKTAKEENYQSRNPTDSGSWRATNHDRGTGSEQRERDQSLKSRSGKADDTRNKKRKEGAYVSRERAVKEDISHNFREGSSRRKRERDDVSDQWKRDEQARVKGEDVHYVRHREDESLHRESNDRERERVEGHRLKLTPGEIMPRREREETRLVMRSGRATEDKAWNSHSRRKDDYRGSSKEYNSNDAGRHIDQLKRRDQIESESFSQHRGHEDIYARVNQPGHDEKRARYERPGPHNDRASHASDTSRVNEHKQKDIRRKGKDSESAEHSSFVPSKRNPDEQGGQASQMVNSRGRPERESGDTGTRKNCLSPKRQHKEDAAAAALSDVEQLDSRRGRSELERWTSNKERDFTTTSISSSLRNKGLDALSNSGTHLADELEEPSKKVEDKPHPQLLVDDKDTGTERNMKPKKVDDKHLDTVAKLKKRRERFKLPMPSEKDTLTTKKIEGEPLASAQTETTQVSDIKPERPARKRRWTGN